MITIYEAVAHLVPAHKIKSKKNPKARVKYRRAVLEHLNLSEHITPSDLCLEIQRSLGINWSGNEKNMRAFIKRAAQKIQPGCVVKQIRKKKIAPTIKPSAYAIKAKSFYQSNEWRSVRYKALLLGYGCCHLCGAKASDGVQLHVDHIKPRSKYPELELTLSNLQILCKSCNLGKSNTDETNWKKNWD